MSTNLELSPEPARGAVFLEELRAVGLGMRRELIALAVIVLGSGLLFSWLVFYYDEKESFPFQPDRVIAFVIVAIVIPLGVWRAENPERRTYLWSLPLSRRSGHVAKLVSGWFWTMLATALIPLWWWAMALVTNSLVWERPIYIERMDLADGSSLELVGGIATYVYSLPGWLLLVPFGFATILYLAGSTLALATNHPFRWGIGLWCLGMALGGLAELGQDAELKEIVERTGGAIDYNTYLEQVADEDRFLERLFGNEAPYGLQNLMDPEVSRPEVIPGTNGPRDVRRADLSNWLSSMALWGGLALLATYLASTKHRDP